jgi:hypothetical protein
MEKRIVGLFAPYTASEKTFCALYFAEHILRRYRHVVWAVPEGVRTGSRYAGFSHKWDKETLPIASKAEEIKSRLSVLDKHGKFLSEICVFFDANDAMYDLLPEGTKTAFFLDPYTWDIDGSRDFAKKCTYVLVASPHVIKKIVQPNLLPNSLLWPFDSMLQLIPKVYIQSGTAATLFYPAYGMSFLERQCLCQVAEIVKACCPASKSVIGYYDAHDAPETGRDARTYDWKLLDYLKQTDWIIDLNPRPLLGLFASFAGAASIQWSGFDLPVNSDEYNAARRHLISFPEGGLIMKNAEDIAEQIVRQLTTPFADDTDRNKNVGAYFRRLKKFTETTNKLFGAKGR